MSSNWSHAVTTRPPSTFAAGGIHNRSARDIYLEYRKPKVSPNGLGSAIQMLVFYVNRAGRNLPEARKKEIMKAVEMLRIELAYLKQAHEVGLRGRPKPVYPPPSLDKRIGGRNGYNWKG